MTTDEQWRPTGLGLYEASDCGRIRRSGRVLRPFPSSAGYLMVKLSIDGAARNRLVHRIVAQTFMGVPGPGQQVNHRDGCKQNNSLCNLEYVTASQNMRHAIRSGLHRAPSPVRDYAGSHWCTRDPTRVTGENNPRARLTTAQVVQIRAAHAAGRKKADVAREFGVSPSLIHAIVNRLVWRHVG